MEIVKFRKEMPSAAPVRAEAERLETPRAEPHDPATEPPRDAPPVDEAVSVELSAESLAAARTPAEFPDTMSVQGGAKEVAAEQKSSPPSDDAAQLTRRLVAAASQFEVQQVMMDAGKSMTKLRAAAASGDPDTVKAAQACIKRLERLISRGMRKVKDLNKEDSLRISQAQAEARKQRFRAEEIKDELRKRIRERVNRERTYLTGDEKEVAGVGKASPGKMETRLDAASEAEIAIRAEAMAAAEFSGGTGGGGAEAAVEMSGGGAEAGGEAGGGEVSGGAEAAGGEGGAGGGAEG